MSHLKPNESVIGRGVKHSKPLQENNSPKQELLENDKLVNLLREEIHGLNKENLQMKQKLFIFLINHLITLDF